MSSSAELTELPLADPERRLKVTWPNSSFPLKRRKLKPWGELTCRVPGALEYTPKIPGIFLWLH